MFKRSQHSAFIPYQRPHQPQLFIPSHQASLFLGKMDLPMFERQTSNKPMKEEELFSNCLSQQPNMLQHEPLLLTKSRKNIKIESAHLSSLDDDSEMCEEDFEDFSLESAAYQSTKASSRTTPILADLDI
jgi:hypothetical protein